MGTYEHHMQQVRELASGNPVLTKIQEYVERQYKDNPGAEFYQVLQPYVDGLKAGLGSRGNGPITAIIGQLEGILLEAAMTEEDVAHHRHRKEIAGL